MTAKVRTKSTRENMRSKIICLLGLALAGLLFTGCATSHLTRLQDVSSNEAVVVAKFHIIHNGQDQTKDCAVLFNTSAYGEKYGFRLDEGGYVVVKLPVGKDSLDMLCTSWKRHLFGPEELTCEVSGGGAINYIGDITMDWNGTGSGAVILSTIGGGIIGGTLAGSATQGKIVVTVDSNVAAAQEAFRQKFPADKILMPSLLVVNPRQ
jgi:hypothetical protein